MEKMNQLKEMIEAPNYKKCEDCGTMIPTERANKTKNTITVNMAYGQDKVPIIDYNCPICDSWLFSIMDQESCKPLPYLEPLTREEVGKKLSQIIQSLDNKPNKINLEKKMAEVQKPKGTVIVIEGTDGSGKQTQSEMLLNRLREMGVKASLYSFPNYDSLQGQIVKRYLNGEFKGQPKQDYWNEWYRNALMYANDRLVTCMEKGEDGRSILDKYNDGEVIIFDRYTQSNFIHQGCHIEDQEDLEDFINYFMELEYDYLGLPEPDQVIYLRVSPEMSMQNIEKRGIEKDMHENIEALRKANKHTDFLIDWLGWEVIQCSGGLKNKDTGEATHYMNSREDIHVEVFSLVEQTLVENNQLRHVKYCTECLKSNMYNQVEIKNRNWGIFKRVYF